MVQQRARLVEYQSANDPSLSHGCSKDGKQRADGKELPLSFQYQWLRLLLGFDLSLILNCLCEEVGKPTTARRNLPKQSL
jgi:hypothetical protein